MLDAYRNYGVKSSTYSPWKPRVLQGAENDQKLVDPGGNGISDRNTETRSAGGLINHMFPTMQFPHQNHLLPPFLDSAAIFGGSLNCLT